MHSRSLPRGALPVVLSVLSTLAVAGAGEAARAAPTSDLCRTLTTEETARHLARSERALVVEALRPGSEAPSWAGPFTEIVSDTTVLFALCADAAFVHARCALCRKDGSLPATVETAPALVLRRMTGLETLFDPRVRARDGGR